ncbi:MAG: hypothetical protein FGM24_04385 [Candidatus Kapabacteria bacterium]|nr:hypothetical protein [Candidatus Kapabacteria bacterium]
MPAVTSSSGSPTPQPSRSKLSQASRRVIVAAPASVWSASLDTLRHQVGVTEATGRNDGAEVEQYLRSVNLGRGNPWCYALQYWSFAVVSQRPPVLRTGLVAAAWNDAVRRGTLTPYVVTVGDLIVWRYLAPDTRGHIERVVRIDRGGWVITIGGNVPPEPPRQKRTSIGKLNDRTERDGQGVWPRTRNVRHPIGRMMLRGLIGADTALAPKGYH